jgi:hypothetical protein
MRIPASVAMLLGMCALLLAPARETKNEEASFVNDTDGSFSLNLNPVWVTLAIVLTAVISIVVLAALAPVYFDALASLVGVFTDPSTTTNDTTADALLPVFGIILAIGGLAAIVMLAVAAYRIQRK